MAVMVQFAFQGLYGIVFSMKFAYTYKSYEIHDVN